MSSRNFGFLGIVLLTLVISPIARGGGNDLVTSPAYSYMPGNINYNMLRENPAFSYVPGNRYYYYTSHDDNTGSPGYADKSLGVMEAILGFFGNPSNAKQAVIGQQRLTNTSQDASEKVKATLTQSELSQLRVDLLEGKSLPSILVSLAPGGVVDRGILDIATAFDRRIEPYCSSLPRSARALIAAIWLNRMEDTIHAKSLKANRKADALFSDEETALHNFALSRGTMARAGGGAGTH